MSPHLPVDSLTLILLINKFTSLSRYWCMMDHLCFDDGCQNPSNTARIQKWVDILYYHITTWRVWSRLANLLRNSHSCRSFSLPQFAVTHFTPSSIRLRGVIWNLDAYVHMSGGQTKGECEGWAAVGVERSKYPLTVCLRFATLKRLTRSPQCPHLLMLCS